MGVKKNALLKQFLIECLSIGAAAFAAALLLSGPVTKLVGDGLQTLFYSAGGTEKYEVEIERGTDNMYVNMMPPSKGEALPYAVTAGNCIGSCAGVFNRNFRAEAAGDSGEKIEKGESVWVCFGEHFYM